VAVRISALAAALAAALACTSRPAPSGDEGDPELLARARQLHDSALVIDGHNDITTFILDFGFDLGMDGGGAEKRDATLYWVPSIRWLLPDAKAEDLRMDTDLKRLRAGGVDAQFFSIFVDSRYAPSKPSEAGRARTRALDMIAALDVQIRAHPDALELATSAADIQRIAGQGKIAALMGLEGGHAIENDLETLRHFAELGVRYMTLTWENANDWADSCYEHPHGGLTPFGVEVVHELNRLGVMVDISHVSDETFFAAVAASRTPVIASHSSARALVDRPRNMSDDMLREMARNRGVVLVNFIDAFVDPAKNPTWKAVGRALLHFGWPDTPLSAVIDHIDHIARVAGIDHVGLGSDFAGTMFNPQGIKDVSEFPNITVELVRRGYTDSDVRKILGGNVLRVMAEVEQVGRTLRASEEPALTVP
jgi:membrane dipeptidase